MKTFKAFWNLHKWTGIGIAALLATTAGTGFLLLLKKNVAWIQPPLRQGAAGSIDDFLGPRELFGVIFAHGDPAFAELSDIDRVDFRPAERVFKVRSRHRYRELQVCAVTGAVLSDARRLSDLLESIHDGSFWAAWWHDWIMPLFSASLLVMIFSGFWLWLEPGFRRRKRLRRAASSPSARARGPGSASR